MWLFISRDPAAVLCTLICFFVMIRGPLDFQVAFCLVWKQVFMQNYWKSILPNIFYFHANQNLFHMKGFTQSLIVNRGRRLLGNDISLDYSWSLHMNASCCQDKTSAYHMWSYGPRRLNTALTWVGLLLHLSKCCTVILATGLGIINKVFALIC